MSSSPSPQLALDHIVILLPTAALESLPKAITNAFTITPGGTHADGKTYNKLVTTSSGVYLEFIAFVDDDVEKRKDHWWGKKKVGTIIDWALTSKDVKDVHKLAEAGEYDKPRKGGRKRLDGKDVEWFVTFPKPGTERGSVPFFCHDVTARELRVPSEDHEHSSGAVAVSCLVVIAAKDKIEDIAAAYNEILGESETTEHGKAWVLSSPAHLEDGELSGSYLYLQPATTEEELRLVKDNGSVAGVKEISFWTEADEDSKVEVEFEGRTIRLKLDSLNNL